jgi:hypothetical protein
MTGAHEQPPFRKDNEEDDDKYHKSYNKYPNTCVYYETPLFRVMLIFHRSFRHLVRLVSKKDRFMCRQKLAFKLIETFWAHGKPLEAFSYRLQFPPAFCGDLWIGHLK